MRRFVQIGFGLALSLTALMPSAPADDEKSPSLATKPATTEKSTAPDFSSYKYVMTVWGEVVKSNESNVTLRIYWETVVQTSTTNRGARPTLYSSVNRNHYNPYTIRRPNVQVKTEHHDYTIPYVPESLVRTKTLPKKVGLDGKPVAYTDAEIDALKVPYSAVGYQASKSDLTPGTVVQVSVIRDKTIPTASVKDSDMRVKYAVIWGHDPNPPKDISPSSPGSAKK